ncbi:MAG: MFS transporter [Clostridia bacterium]|nr:MFS transporter [Clostridia bacterium]
MEQTKFLNQSARVRVLILMCFFASSIGDAFNTVYIRSILFDAGETREFFIGIPITAMTAMMVLGVFCSAWIAGRTKDYISYIRLGIILLFLGLLLRGMGINFIVLTSGFAVSGFGTGLLYISVRYYAFMFHDSSQRMRALVYVTGGSFVGQCLGTILGGILAGQIEYRFIYLFSAAFLAVPFIMTLRVKVQGKVETVKYSELFSILRNKHALLFLVFTVLPVYACSIFLSYSVPMYVEDYGFSFTVTSVLILANYLLSAYAGPYCTEKILSKMSAQRSVIIYMLLTAITVISYTVFSNMVSLSALVIICGILDSFGLTALITAFTKNRGKYKYSDNSTLIMFYLFSRIGQMIGPTMISLSGNLSILGIFLLAGVGVSLITNGRKSAE